MVETPEQPASQPHKRAPRILPADVIVFLAGIILPIAALIVEYLYRSCGEIFFVPIPSWYHIGLVLIVPLGNFASWLAFRRNTTKHAYLVGILCGMSVALSLVYAIVFLPITPIAVMVLGMGACFFVMNIWRLGFSTETWWSFALYGLVVLALSPLFALMSSLLCRFWLLRKNHDLFAATRFPSFLGFMAAFVILVLVETPSSITRIGMDMANTPVDSAKGIRFLRTYGDMDTMLRMCYERRGLATDVIGLLFSIHSRVTTEQARKIFYRVTGRPFNSYPLPSHLVAGRRASSQWIDLDWDSDQGFDSVGGVVRGVTLAQSQMDVTIDSQAALAYNEWILSFKNSSDTEHEARAQITLPPGGVVSRLTLWIDGKEREATFDERDKTRKAYQAVVQRNRDPALVSPCGPDGVLVQCFPVPPKGGEIKIRLGITSPLLLEKKDRSLYRLPFIAERNFQVDMPHTISASADCKLASGTAGLAAGSHDKSYTIAGTINHEALGSPSIIEVSRAPMLISTWCDDPAAGDDKYVRQKFTEIPSPTPRHLFFVVDGSQSMKPWIDDVRKQVFSVENGWMDARVLVASDELIELPDMAARSMHESTLKLDGDLSKIEFSGGTDNLPALQRALAMVDNREPSAIIWIHGPQPILLGETSPFEEALETRVKNLSAFEYQVSPGPNRIVESMGAGSPLQSIPRVHGTAADIGSLMLWLQGKEKRLGFSRELLDKKQAPEIGGLKASDRLAALWAYDETLTDLKSGHVTEAQKIAKAHQIITPVSGAVVLETKQQYDQFGLTQMIGNHAGLVPEPGDWVLIGIVAIVFTSAVVRRRRSISGEA